MSHFQAIRGMNDIVPAQISYWQTLEAILRKIAESYGYQEIRFPIVEATALFERTIGQATDIVEKEMYTFQDRNGDSLTLRPEGTAVCVRAAIEQNLLRHQFPRLWYQGPMFRHERPQKGRYRQFHQFGVEAFGMQGPDIDAEQILMTARMWRELGIEQDVVLHLNSLGNPEERKAYRENLITFLNSHSNELDEDSRKRLFVNPLRILDSKNPAMQELIANAPRLSDYLSAESAQHFSGLRRLLDAAGIKYHLNPRLVRGLDYYNLTVFEWVTNKLGAQGTVCGGGRYDALVTQLGGEPTPAVGFSIGLERMIALMEAKAISPLAPDVYLVLVGEQAREQGLLLAEQLHNIFPWMTLVSDCAGGSFKSQFKRADKSGARWALILGEDELASGQVSVKDLRQESPQKRCSFKELQEIMEK